MTSPAVELMKYMEMEIEADIQEAEQKKAEMYIQYLSNIFSQPQEGKPSHKFLKAKREFESMLMPDTKPEKDAKKYEWDFDPNEVLEENNLIEGR